ncbi:hypothetical protein DENIS_3793 [Desulfonema ishimotonii]|uniref:PEP-CTERM protein-sorting domain-containing protein n=2 Tax=Desulfonema ishimotonii TaxID=45657 RepID=A0A401G0U6_9BACT|nr:hypothetical protein DENIS_3793 [Desulfonema ishimotonii]
MKKKLVTLCTTVLSLLLLSSPVLATPTTVVSLGDTLVENVRTSNLNTWFKNEVITNTDGSEIDSVEDQVQYELFYTDTSREYEVEFLGIGQAGYHSPFGVFTYTGNPSAEFDEAYITYQNPLFVQNEVDDYTTYNFTIEAGSYFGFYLDANGSGRYVTTMVSSNSDDLDHALFFETNKGYTIAFEDIIGGGDKDYEDLIVNFTPTDDSGFAATPEPGTFVLLGFGLIGLAGFGRKRILK